MICGKMTFNNPSYSCNIFYRASRNEIKEIGTMKINEKYNIGKLYIFNENYELAPYIPTQEDIEKHPNFLFDKRNCENVHIFPRDIRIGKSCSDAIANKLKEIRKIICISDSSLVQSMGSGRAVICRDTIQCESDKLFQYIPLIYKDVRYDVTAIRFFKSETEVNCILNSMQIKVYQGKEPFSLQNYPMHGGDDVNYDDEAVYYNIPIRFEDSSEQIASQILQFVKRE